MHNPGLAFAGFWVRAVHPASAAQLVGRYFAYFVSMIPFFGRHLGGPLINGNKDGAP